MSKDAIDFSPLENYSLSRVLKSALSRTLRSKRLLIFVIIYFALASFNAYSVLNSKEWINSSGREFEPWTPFILIPIVLAVICCYYISKHRRSSLDNFANVNHWNIRKPSVNESLPLSMQGYQHYLPGKLVEMKIDGFTWDMFLIDRAEHGRYTVFRGKSNKQLPSLVIDSHQARGIPRRPKDLELVRLEGNFYKDFTIYFEKKGQADALSILDPSFMETLQKYHSLFDVEMAGQTVFVVADGDMRDSKTLSTVIELFEKLHTFMG